MKNKKIVLLILVLLILVVALGLWLLQGEFNNNNTSIPPTASDMINNNASDNDNDELAISSDEATYEEWLAASMVTAISLTYPDFEIQEISAVSETGMDEMEQSEGAYIKFVSGGETIVVRSEPIDEERTKKGTVDLYEQKLGFATFDVVKADALENKELKAIDVNALSELIAESLLVSLYEHY